MTRTNFHSVERSLQAWIEANGCGLDAEEHAIAAAEDDLRVTRKVWSGGRDGAEVVLYTIHDGGHTWPGREARLRLLGRSTKAISANDLMWEFFQRHARK